MSVKCHKDGLILPCMADHGGQPAFGAGFVEEELVDGRHELDALRT
jgi:hypothetical protein